MNQGKVAVQALAVEPEFEVPLGQHRGSFCACAREILSIDRHWRQRFAGYGVRLATKAIGLSVPHRMTGADWIWGVAALCEAHGRSLPAG